MKILSGNVHFPKLKSVKLAGHIISVFVGGGERLLHLLKAGARFSCTSKAEQYT